MTITVNPSDLNEIKSVLGSYLGIQIEWDDTYITDIVLPRVIRNYFTYYPLIEENDYLISRQFEIDYPSDPNVFSLHKHFFNHKDADYITQNPFVLQQMMYFGGGNLNNFSYNGLSESISRIPTSEAIVDFSKAYSIHDRQNERKVFGYTNVDGTLYLQFAKYSQNFDDIRFNHKDDAIQLAKAYLMQDTSRIRSQINIQTKADINVEQLRADGEREQEQIFTRWKRNSFAVVVK